MQVLLASLLFLLMIFSTGHVFASCFRDHLREAIALNRERMPLYAELTGGRSLPVSKALIASENRLLILSWLFDIDHRARRFELAGIGVTCESFLPMENTPPFRPRFPDGPVPESRVYSLASLEVESRLRRAFQRGGERELGLEAQRILKVMDREKRIHCMTRHTLESIARISILQSRHEEQARKNSLPSPASLHRWMLKGHLSLLETTQRLDRMALPFNRKGIPLICQDVPPIPLPEGASRL